MENVFGVRGGGGLPDPAGGNTERCVRKSTVSINELSGATPTLRNGRVIMRRTAGVTTSQDDGGGNYDRKEGKKRRN